MTLKTVEINTDLTEARKIVIDSLETMLEQAKRGEIDGFVGAVSFSSGNVRRLTTGQIEPYATAGCLQEAIIDILG